MDLIKKTEKSLRENNLLAYGDQIVVGVSGGPDSTALLHILNSLRNKLGIKLYAAHLNHQLRPGANRDERFIKTVCEKLGIPCSSQRATIKTSAKKSSIEEAAREKRFDFLIKVAKTKKARIIALAHTSDDLAETVLMRILRGTGLLGLQGILPGQTRQDVHIIRPLIAFPKKDILAFLKKNKIKFCTDPTNRSTQYFRNKIRLQLLPLLQKQYQPNISEILNNLANNTSIDYDYIRQKAGEELQKLAKMDQNHKLTSLKLPGLGTLHPALQRMVIRLAIQNLKGNLNQLSLKHMKEIEDLLKQRPSGSEVNLPHNITVQKNQNFLILAVRKT